MESKIRNQRRLLDTQLGCIWEFTHNDTENSQVQPNISTNDQPLDLQKLKNKISVLLSGPNNPEVEKDFRRTCVRYQEISSSDPELNEAYQEYVKTYHKITSLYLISDESLNSNKFAIYDTEREEMKFLETPKSLDWGTSIAQLPNGELFCFGSRNPTSGITFIIGNDYEVRVLPSGKSCFRSSVIYFNRSVYCFGGHRVWSVSLSRRFDLDSKRWSELAPIPHYNWWSSSVVFNGNILMSGSWNRNIFQYSVDINSFSTIPYEFDKLKCKILINAEERLYLFECANMSGSIFESEILDEYTWKRIEIFSVGFLGWQVSCSYNKGEMYISCIKEMDNNDKKGGLYKFSFSQKKLTLLG